MTEECPEHGGEALPCGWCALHRKLQWLAVVLIAWAAIALLRDLS